MTSSTATTQSVSTTYAAHLYTSVRIKVEGISANSAQQAAERAVDLADLSEILRNPKPLQANIACVEWDEGPITAVLIDEINVQDDTQVGDGVIIEMNASEIGKLVDEDKHVQAAKACKEFMSELLETWDSLEVLGQVYGLPTLAVLLYLSSAIMEDGFVEELDTQILAVLDELPSAQRWKDYVNTDAETFVIYSDTEDQAAAFWGDDGWTPLAGASTFRKNERNRLTLPLGGQWLLLAQARAMPS